MILLSYTASQWQSQGKGTSTYLTVQTSGSLGVPGTVEILQMEEFQPQGQWFCYLPPPLPCQVTLHQIMPPNCLHNAYCQLTRSYAFVCFPWCLSHPHCTKNIICMRARTYPPTLCTTVSPAPRKVSDAQEVFNKSLLNKWISWQLALGFDESKSQATSSLYKQTFIKLAVENSHTSLSGSSMAFQIPVLFEAQKMLCRKCSLGRRQNIPAAGFV